MESDKHLDNKIRQGFEAQSAKAPENLWARVEDELNRDLLDEKIRSSFDQNTQAPPEGVWSNINRQMNIDRVWKRISAELDRKPIVIFWRRLGAVAAMVFLFSGAVYWGNDLIHAPSEDRAGNQQPDQENVETMDQPVGTKTVLKASGSPTHGDNSRPKEQPPLSEQTTREGSTKLKESNPTLEHVTTESLTSEKPFVSSENGTDHLKMTGSATGLYSFGGVKKNLPLSGTEAFAGRTAPMLAFIEGRKWKPLDLNVNKSPVFEEMEEEPDEAQQSSKLSVGLLTLGKRTWLLNNEWRRSMNRESLVQGAEPSLSMDWALTCHYALNHRHGLSMEVFIQSVSKQKQGIYGKEGVFYNKETRLDHRKLALMYSRNFNYRTGPEEAMSNRMKIGLYGALLKQQALKLSGFELSDKPYKNTDFGLVLGLSQVHHFQHLMVEYGVRGEYGISNIYKGDDLKPQHFDVTKNAQLGLFINISYKI